MQVDDGYESREIMAARVAAAVMAMDESFSDQFRERDLEGAVQMILYNLLSQREAFVGLTVALSTGSVSEPIPVELKGYVLRSFEFFKNPYAYSEPELYVYPESIKTRADIELEKVEKAETVEKVKKYDFRKRKTREYWGD